MQQSMEIVHMQLSPVLPLQNVKGAKLLGISLKYTKTYVM